MSICVCVECVLHTNSMSVGARRGHWPPLELDMQAAMSGLM